MSAVRPTDVVVARSDGTKVPCELLYEGEVDGVHVWSSMTEVDKTDVVEVGVWPARTAINFTAHIDRRNDGQ